MFARVSIYDDKALLETVDIDYIEDRYNFTYIDNGENKCSFVINDKGLIFNKKTSSYELDLHLIDDAYALITSNEGQLKLDAKVVDYCVNDDILEMHYLIDGDRKRIVINFNRG